MNWRNWINQNISALEKYFSYLNFHLNFSKKPFKKNSVYFLLPSLSLVGANIIYLEYANQLRKLGLEVVIIILKGKNKAPWFPEQKVKIISINEINKFPSPQVLIGSAWITAYYMSRLKAKKKIYFVQTIESLFREKFSLLTFLINYTYKKNYIFLTEAKWIKKYLKKHHQKSAFYLPNGLNKQLFKPSKPLIKKGNKLRILIEGSLVSAFKGIEESFQVIKGLDCQVWLLSYSGKPKKDWHYHKFFSNVPYSQMNKVYSSCDLLLKMSRAEGMFAPPLEMMACGGTAIVTKVKGYKEYIKHGFNALIVEIDDINKAKYYLKKLIVNKKLLLKLKKAGLTTAKKWPTWKQQAKKLKKFLFS